MIALEDVGNFPAAEESDDKLLATFIINKVLIYISDLHPRTVGQAIMETSRSKSCNIFPDMICGTPLLLTLKCSCHLVQQYARRPVSSNIAVIVIVFRDSNPMQLGMF